MMNSLSLRLSVFVNYTEEEWDINNGDRDGFSIEHSNNFTNFSEHEHDQDVGGNIETIDKAVDVGDGDFDELPEAFTKVSPAQWPIIYAYSIVFIIAAVGNFTEFYFVYRRLRKRSTAMNRLMLHLCVADIIVIFMVAAVEVFWRISIGWYAGDFMCKLIQYFRAFSLYLSSLMLICLSLDRFYAVVYPLRAVDASRRVKIMLSIAWITAALCAAPQCIVFTVQQHPIFPAFKQCNSVLSGVLAEAINTAISMSFMYFLPILVIIFSYGNILIKLARETDETGGGDNRFLRRSGASLMDRAKIKTLKLSFVIVMAFVLCWTPYVIISIWHIVDRESAENLNPYIQESLFIMVVSNSSVNPLVYGIFSSSKKSSRNRNGNAGNNNHQRSQPSVSRTAFSQTRRKVSIVAVARSSRQSGTGGGRNANENIISAITATAPSRRIRFPDDSSSLGGSSTVPSPNHHKKPNGDSANHSI